MDLFDVLESQRKIDATNWLQQISVNSAPNMQEEDFRKFIGDLRKEAGLGVVTKSKFDEAGFEALKMQLKMGI
ncbi:hypothetical protein [Paenibacillus terrigena]|uniref:hypothetical protein n=1 Tax=Paenibacillus terrigena TaxID=369333 RepID=UPI00036FFC6E|nr:hypothetical protein [Paenibacillus terrigena]